MLFVGLPDSGLHSAWLPSHQLTQNLTFPLYCLKPFDGASGNKILTPRLFLPGPDPSGPTPPGSLSDTRDRAYYQSHRGTNGREKNLYSTSHTQNNLKQIFKVLYKTIR